MISLRNIERIVTCRIASRALRRCVGKNLGWYLVMELERESMERRRVVGLTFWHGKTAGKWRIRRVVWSNVCTRGCEICAFGGMLAWTLERSGVMVEEDRWLGHAGKLD
ncbi:hypothetical protein Hanom_Chr05g00457111 [Helianthus anomalus]